MVRPVCVIVGAGPGVGLAVARRFGREGMAIALLARSDDKVQRYAADLAQDGITAQGFAADADDLDQLAAVLQQVARELGPSNVLIYNAVAFTPGPVSTLSADHLLAGVRVSAAGALVAAQQVLPAMRAQGQGTILFTGGGAALSPIPGLISLSIGKSAIRMLAYGLAQELEGSGIRVGTVTIFGGVAPGTDFDPDKIAERYWAFHSQPGEGGTVEISYRGAQ